MIWAVPFGFSGGLIPMFSTLICESPLGLAIPSYGFLYCIPSYPICSRWISIKWVVKKNNVRFSCGKCTVDPRVCREIWEQEKKKPKRIPGVHHRVPVFTIVQNCNFGDYIYNIIYIYIYIIYIYTLYIYTVFGYCTIIPLYQLYPVQFPQYIQSKTVAGVDDCDNL